MKIHIARSLHPILKLREEGQEEDSDSPAVTQLQGQWGKNVTPFPWASKSVLFCYSDSSITKQISRGNCSRSNSEQKETGQ